MPTFAAVIDRLQRFLRATAATRRDVVPVPPFTAYFTREDPLKYLNYAIPDGDVEPSREDIERLRDAFHERGRLPRLEWIEECAPSVVAAVGDAGMTQELRTPLMACGPGELIAPTADVPDLTVRPLQDGDVRDASNVQRVAFGQPALRDDDDPGHPRARGGGGVIARSGEEAVAAGNWTRVIDGVSEVAGIATAEAWRRRGLAGAVTAAAAREAFAAGASLCVLSPGDDTALRVYERAGFRRVATMLHWSDERPG